jgi:hypothetical protein
MNRLDLEQAIRKVAAVSPEEKAIPNLRDVVGAYTAQEATENEQARATGARLDLGKKTLAESGQQFAARLAESGRQFGNKLTESSREFTSKIAENRRELSQKHQLDRDYLDAWSDANKWATAISIGNLGLTGLNMEANLKDIAKQDALQKNIIGTMRANSDRQLSGARQQRLDLEEALSEITKKRSRPADIYPVGNGGNFT